MKPATTHAALRQAEDLRQRLIRTAYALHFSADRAAGLVERQAEIARPPTPVDGPLLAKRWRGVSERALEVVENWDSDTHANGTPRPRLPSAPAQPLDMAAMADDVVRHLFNAGLCLQSVMASTAETDRSRLGEVIDEIEQAIREIRTFVFDLAAHHHPRRSGPAE